MAETTEVGVPPAAREGKAHVFPCEGCGADLEFHIGLQQLKCPYCGFVKQLERDPEAEVAEQDLAAALERARSRQDRDRRDEEGLEEVRCDNCGGTVRFSGTLTSRECPYCATHLQLENVHDAPHRISVDGVLPFVVQRDQARENLGRWVRSRWFAPNRFRRRGVRGQFNGVYLPYWTFDTHCTAHYAGQRGEYHWVTVGSGKNRRRSRHTRWSPAAGSFQQLFDDVLIFAARGFPEEVIRRLEPWPLDRSDPFHRGLLAGFVTRTYDVDLPAGFDLARQSIDRALEQEARRRIGGDVQIVASVESTYNAITYKHLLLPIWLLAYRSGGPVYRVVVNACTGEVQGERPYSRVKIALTALAALFGVGLIALLAGLG